MNKIPSEVVMVLLCWIDIIYLLVVVHHCEIFEMTGVHQSSKIYSVS